MSRAFLKVAFLGAGLAMSLTLAAEPNGVKESFSQRQLPEDKWSLAKGDASSVSIHNKSLWLFPSSQGTTLRFRYYPLRDDHERPAFGSFSAKLSVRFEPSSSPVAFSLSSGAWRASLELAPPPSSQATLLVSCGESRVESQPLKLQAPQDGKLVLELVYRVGSSVEAFVSSGGKRAFVSSWKGNPPRIVDFEISALPGGKDSDAVRVESFEIDALPLDRGYSSILPRDGSPLPGDSSLPERVRSTGGQYLGGYLWSKGESPALPILVSSLLAAEDDFVLKTSVTDWQDRLVSSSEIPFKLGPFETRSVQLPLSDSSYGSFHFNCQLFGSDGLPVEPGKTVDFGITAAPLAKDLPSSSPVGIHYGAFGRIGAKWVRYWDNGNIAWSSMEKEKGKWDWSAADAYIQRTVDAGLEPLVVLAGIPEWASSDTSYANYMGRGSFSPPKDLADWRNYCSLVAKRYKGKVKCYEVWNEPNGNELGPKGFFFYGSVEQYFELLKVAYEAVKEADPDAKVLAPSGTGHFFPFLEALVKLGGLKYFDILSIHTYCVPLPPEIGYHFNGEKSYKHRVDRSREIMAAGGDVKPIWNTEIGYQNEAPKVAGIPMRPEDCMKEFLPGKWPNIYPGWPFRWGDQRRFTDFTVRFYILSKAYGVEKTFYHHRLIEDRASPRMAAPAVGFFSKLLGQASYDRELKLDKNLQAHCFKLEDGASCLAFWRVEPETLNMNHELDRKIGKVDSAPLQSAAQASLGSVGAAPRDEYFFPNRSVPLSVSLSGVSVSKVYDIWGNEIAFNGSLPVEEAPCYVVFKGSSEALAAEVSNGTPKKASASSEPPPSGSLSSSPTARQSAQKPEEIIPSLQRLDVKLERLGSKNEQHGTTFYLRNVEPLVFSLPGAMPAKGRVMISARCRGFSYSLGLGGAKSEFSSWLAWPEKILCQGQGWSEVQGLLVSPELDFAGAKEISVSCDEFEGRVYWIWLWPSK